MHVTEVQGQSDGDDLHPIVFISNKLLLKEIRYSIVEKECLVMFDKGLL